MVKKSCLIFTFLLLFIHAATGQEKSKYTDSKLIKSIKKKVRNQAYSEAYELVLKNKDSLPYQFVEGMEGAYHSNYFIDTVRVDSAQLFHKNDKLHCIGMYINPEYSNETKDGITERILIKKGNGAVRPFDHFGKFVKLSKSEIRKIKRKMKKRGWYQGKIDTSWDKYCRAQLVYFVYLETKSPYFPIYMHDKMDVYESILLSVLPPKPFPPGIASDLHYRKIKKIASIEIRDMKKGGYSASRKIITNKKAIRRFIRLVEKMRYIPRPNTPKRYNSDDLQYLIIVNYRYDDHYVSTGIGFIKTVNGLAGVGKSRYYICPDNLFEINPE